MLNLIDWVPPEVTVFFSSTSEVYAGGVNAGLVEVPTAEDVPVHIQDIAAPRFAYAVSKALGEAAILHASAQGRLSGVIERLHNVYGARMGADHVIPEMLLRAARGTDPFVIPGADQARAFCHVDDAVSAVLALMNTPDAVGRIVHIGADRNETNIGDLARRVAAVVGVHPHFVPAPSPAGSVARRRPDLTLLHSLTDFVPTVSLDDGLARTWQWYQAAAR